MIVPGSQEEYQLSWAPNEATVSINVGDERDVDLCAYEVFSHAVVAPTERGYFAPEPRTLMERFGQLTVRLRVTCENGRPLILNILLQSSDQGLSVRVLDK